MRARIRSKWRNKGTPVSIEANALAVSAAIWRLALTAAKDLHAHDYVYDNDRQRIGVITEYAIFLIHVADRYVFELWDSDQRARFVSNLAADITRHVQQNCAELFGAGDYREPFTANLNDRAAEYAQTEFEDSGPGYSTYRCIGAHIQEIMGESQTNRWVLDQIIEIDAPQTVRLLHKTMQALIRSAPIQGTATNPNR
ncbi:MAG: hypothetical protein OES26_08915 [Gammaproteobacteria bacterium]|nr:hypothetical protein [Gammaproteobacteria bacterium]